MGYVFKNGVLKEQKEEGEKKPAGTPAGPEKEDSEKKSSQSKKAKVKKEEE
jgi:hypothetical protein